MSEPVAWMYDRGHSRHIHKTRLRNGGSHYYGEGFTETPLYTRPEPDTEVTEAMVEAGVQAYWMEGHDLIPEGEHGKLILRNAELIAENERLREAVKAALAPLDEVGIEVEDALVSEGIFTWGPDGERFERMFEVVMKSRRATLSALGEKS